ncbi:D-alanyl-D-alanine carboxypeptidase [Penaeicola halotolerans]|uniref:D-alanyl-D-alanine carboxypeptidase n=1 Tax=Penaeicola halotolerans TaxID=2793196 RepID=UPI001CF8ACFD|nr:D-alanyl-D-alanine carboxypeptidase [Penaeicola halotolerans]
MSKSLIKISVYLLVAWLLSGCASSQHRIKGDKELKRLYTKDGFFTQHLSCLMLMDLSEGKIIHEINPNIYFNPASTTKLLTFYAGEKLLSAQSIALRYSYIGDTVHIWGTGDPSFLYSKTAQGGAFEFLKLHEGPISYSEENFKDERYGPGWAWDDYSYAFAAERSPLPIYGNLAYFQRNPNFSTPATQSKYMDQWLNTRNTSGKRIERDFHQNAFYYNPDSLQLYREQAIPFITSGVLTAQLLADTLQKLVIYQKTQLPDTTNILLGVRMDSLYQEMLQESDNFIAEQILLQISDAKLGYMNSHDAIAYITNLLYTDTPSPLVWKDGSGLSRYNLLTPASLLHVLKKIYLEVPEDRLFELLAQGGVSGSLKNNFGAETPYIFAKSGSFSNNYNLAGYLIADSGKRYAFVLMNNQFAVSVSTIRNEVEKVLQIIKKKY